MAITPAQYPPRASLLERLTEKQAESVDPGTIKLGELYRLVYDPEIDGGPIVHIDKHGPVQLGAPRLSVAHRITAATSDAGKRGEEDVFPYIGCACLVECWPKGRSWPGHPAPRRIRARDSIIERGADIMDALESIGFDLAMIVVLMAMRWAIHNYAARVKNQGADLDFFEAPTGG